MKKKFNKAETYAGEALKRLRYDKNLTQPDIAIMLGLTYQQIQKYEKGQNKLSIGAIDAICKELDISPLIFFEGYK